MLDPSRLVFIDETCGEHYHGPPLWPLPARRAVDRARPAWNLEDPDLRGWPACDEMGAPMVIEGAMNGEIFLSYVEQCLAPALNHGDIVVMDNVSVHKVAGVEQAIENVGAELLYLPKYSPDLNPIEMSFSKLKAYLRKAAERTSPRRRRALASFVPRLGAENVPTTSLMPDMFQYDRETL